MPSTPKDRCAELLALAAADPNILAFWLT